jgi:hypothetical protein
MNYCLSTFYSGPSQGGSRRSANNYGVCPECGKRIQITRSGRLRSHGTKSTKK